MPETIKTYQGGDIGASQCLVTLEGFLGDMENAELADDSTVDVSDAVTAINGLIWSLERREAEIERLRTIIKDAHEEMIAERGEYHIKSGLGQVMAAVVQQTKREE